MRYIGVSETFKSRVSVTKLVKMKGIFFKISIKHNCEMDAFSLRSSHAKKHVGGCSIFCGRFMPIAKAALVIFANRRLRSCVTGAMLQRQLL